jgi:hypothetical protein
MISNNAQFQDFSATYPSSFYINFAGGVQMNSGTSLTFTIPDTNSFASGVTLMRFTSPTAQYVLGGNIILGTASVIPQSVQCFSFSFFFSDP